MNKNIERRRLVNFETENVRYIERRQIVKSEASVTNRLPTPANSTRNLTAAQHWFILTDLLAVVLGFVCALVLTVLINDTYFHRPVPWVTNVAGIEHIAQLLAIAVFLILWFENEGHYRNRMPFWMETQKVINVIFFAMMMDVFLQFAHKQDFSRTWLVSGWIITSIAILFGRSFMRAILQKKGLWRIRVLLVGNGSLAKDALVTIKAETSIGYDLAAQISHLPKDLKNETINWRELCARQGVDYVILAMDGSESSTTDVVIDQLLREGITFSVFSPLQNLPAQHLTMHHFLGRRAFLMVCDSKLEQILPRFLKRCFDLVAASLALILLSPFLLLISLIVRKDGGPALFKHKRLGISDQSFGCMKFRSMAMNSDNILKKHLEENAHARAEWDKDHKLKNDPRVTALGSFLRRSSLDELPQLINVLRGEMSLVGPRPIVMAEVHRYDNDINHYNRVRPGITGLWQVSGRNDVSYAERVKMDAWYVCNWSLWLDITIICKTIPVLLNRKGAY